MTKPLQIVMQLVLVGLLLRHVFRRPGPAWMCWAASAAGMAVFVADSVSAPPSFVDFKIFLNAGSDVIFGRDPYSQGLVLSTPQVLAVFSLLATVPSQLSHHAMLASLWIGPVVLTWLGAAAVGRVTGRPPLPPYMLGVLSATLALSFSYRYGMDLGQLGVLTAFGLLAAVTAQRAGYPWLAGAGLFVGSLKIATMLPFLVLFLHRRDWKAWAVLLALGLAATLAANPPELLVERCRNCLANIAAQSQPGGVNDVSSANTSAVEILSFDRLAYCVGLRGPLAGVASVVCLLLAGAGVAYAVLRPGYLSRPAAVALVSVYASMFLYHRVYDTVLLAGALVWAVDVATTSTGRSRWMAVGVCLSVLAVWFVRLGTLRAVAAAAREGDGLLNWLLSGVVLAYPMWALIAAGVPIVVADRSLRAECEGRL